MLSDKLYHEVSTRAVVCPISRNRGPWAFNVLLPPGMVTGGVVLVDQVRTVHRASRVFDVIERAPAQVLDEVRDMLAALLGIDARLTSTRGGA